MTSCRLTVIIDEDATFHHKPLYSCSPTHGSWRSAA